MSPVDVLSFRFHCYSNQLLGFQLISVKQFGQDYFFAVNCGRYQNKKSYFGNMYLDGVNL